MLDANKEYGGGTVERDMLLDLEQTLVDFDAQYRGDKAQELYKSATPIDDATMEILAGEAGLKKVRDKGLWSASDADKDRGEDTIPSPKASIVDLILNAFLVSLHKGEEENFAPIHPAAKSFMKSAVRHAELNPDSGISEVLQLSRRMPLSVSRSLDKHMEIEENMGAGTGSQESFAAGEVYKKSGLEAALERPHASNEAPLTDPQGRKDLPNKKRLADLVLVNEIASGPYWSLEKLVAASGMPAKAQKKLIDSLRKQFWTHFSKTGKK